MGIRTAFTLSADFSEMLNEARTLGIDAVIHEAFIEVDEMGTQAAAATGKHCHWDVVWAEDFDFIFSRCADGFPQLRSNSSRCQIEPSLYLLHSRSLE